MAFTVTGSTTVTDVRDGEIGPVGTEYRVQFDSSDDGTTPVGVMIVRQDANRGTALADGDSFSTAGSIKFNTNPKNSGDYAEVFNRFPGNERRAGAPYTIRIQDTTDSANYLVLYVGGETTTINLSNPDSSFAVLSGPFYYSEDVVKESGGVYKEGRTYDVSWTFPTPRPAGQFQVPITNGYNPSSTRAFSAISSITSAANAVITLTSGGQTLCNNASVGDTVMVAQVAGANAYNGAYTITAVDTVARTLTTSKDTSGITGSPTLTYADIALSDGGFTTSTNPATISNAVTSQFRSHFWYESPGDPVIGDTAYLNTGPVGNPTSQRVFECVELTISGITETYTWEEKSVSLAGNQLIPSTTIRDVFIDGPSARGGVAGNWDGLVDTDITHLNTGNILLNDLMDGAGKYRFIMVGAGGAGCAADPTISGRRAASGGGSGSIAFWSLDWDGTTDLYFYKGLGGNVSNSALGSGGDGTASEFYIGGTASTDMYIVCPGGSGGSKDLTAGNQNDGGDGAAIAYLDNSGHSMITETDFRTGSRGGHATHGGSANGAACAGGGGVNFLGLSGTDPCRGGDADVGGTASAAVATGGGGIFGPGVDRAISLSTQVVYSTTSQGPTGAGKNMQADSSSTSESSFRSETAFGNNLVGKYLGSATTGRSIALNSITTSSTGYNRDVTANAGVMGGGGAACMSSSSSANPDHQRGQDGFLFGGGGAGASVFQNYGGDNQVFGGNGGVGGGGGGGMLDADRVHSDGGNGAIFWLRLA